MGQCGLVEVTIQSKTTLLIEQDTLPSLLSTGWF